MNLLPSYFLASLFLTMLILYLVYPEPKIVVKYPSPEDDISDVYVDDNDVCYRYKRQEVILGAKDKK